jgi:hypothetical protein
MSKLDELIAKYCPDGVEYVLLRWEYSMATHSRGRLG